MRKNCKEAVKAFRERKECRKAESIWSNGDALYSYATPLLERDGDTLYLNRTKYSVTTSVHQGALGAEFPNAVRVSGVPRGYSREKLSSFPKETQ
jgi:hypothetical protein